MGHILKIEELPWWPGNIEECVQPRKQVYSLEMAQAHARGGSIFHATYVTPYGQRERTVKALSRFQPVPHHPRPPPAMDKA